MAVFCRKTWSNLSVARVHFLQGIYYIQESIFLFISCNIIFIMAYVEG